MMPGGVYNKRRLHKLRLDSIPISEKIKPAKFKPYSLEDY